MNVIACIKFSQRVEHMQDAQFEHFMRVCDSLEVILFEDANVNEYAMCEADSVTTLNDLCRRTSSTLVHFAYDNVHQLSH